MIKIKSTTVCAVLKDGKVTIGADGQATMGNTVAKSNVNKIRVLLDGKILAGFAGFREVPKNAETCQKIPKNSEKYPKMPENAEKFPQNAAKKSGSDIQKVWK